MSTILKILLIVFGFLALLVMINHSHAQEYDGYLSDEYSYPNGGVPPPEVVPAPSQMTRGLDDRDYGYSDNMGWHSYQRGTPRPGGWP